MKKLTLLLILTLYGAGAAVAQQALTGHWEGAIEVPGGELGFKTHITEGETDALGGTIDVQGVTLPLQDIRAAGDSLFFAFKAGPGLAAFKGTFSSDTTIAGSFHQNGMTYPFSMSRYDPEAQKAQEEEARTYSQQELIIENDSIKIGGTLTWPEEHPTDHLVIMISGSGPQDRDESLEPVSNFKPFALLADSLTGSGIATFRYDDRGVGQSTGSFWDTTLEMLASDVEAIINEFTDGSGRDYNTITLLGHSQGGVVAGRVAARNTAVDRLILMASTGVPLKDITLFQSRQGLEQAGIDTALINREIEARQQLIEAISHNADLTKPQQQYQQISMQVQRAAGVDSSDAAAQARVQVGQFTGYYQRPQIQSLLNYDPPSDLRRLDIPVLVLFGGKDTQVTTEMNRPPIDQALEESEARYRVEVFPGANHLFQKAKSGHVQEYGQLENRFTEGFTNTISTWIMKQNQ